MKTTTFSVHSGDTPLPTAQRRRDLFILAWWWLPALTIPLFLWLVVGLDPAVLMRDPAYTTNQPAYLGLVTNLAVVGWAVAAAAFFATAYLASAAGQGTRHVTCNALAGGFLVVLMLDDLLQLHEAFDRHIMTELVVFGVYFVAVAGWVWFFRAELGESPAVVLLAAGAMFALSIGVDVKFAGGVAEWRVVAEDLAKLLGIVALVVYALTNAARKTRSIIGAHPPDGAPAPSQRLPSMQLVSPR